MPSLVGETQSAFVVGRQILDGALIANEVINDALLSCLTTASIFVLVNGPPSVPFRMERGLR